MTKFNAIEKVVWYIDFLKAIHQSPNGDRMGHMVAFKLQKAVNQKYVADKALAFLRHAFAIMGLSPSSDLEFGEQSDCWVVWDNEQTIYVKHKYWTRDQFFLFKEIIEGAARYHDWEEENMEAA